MYLFIINVFEGMVGSSSTSVLFIGTNLGRCDHNVKLQQIPSEDILVLTRTQIPAIYALQLIFFVV